jgi:hypothetical protein
VNWDARKPLQVANGALTRLVYELKTQLSAREYVGLLDTAAALVAHDLARPANWGDWGEWPSRSERPPTPLQIASTVFRALIFELREQLTQDDYVELLKCVAELVAEELAEHTDWAEWEERPA